MRLTEDQVRQLVRDEINKILDVKKATEETAALELQIKILESSMHRAQKIVNPSTNPSFEAALKRSDCLLKSLQQRLSELRDLQKHEELVDHIL
jgi:hypothetical protein